MQKVVSDKDLQMDCYAGVDEQEASPVYQLLKQMEELSCRHAKLKQELEARDRVLGLTSHDLMSPINAINGYLDLMKLALNTDADIDQLSGYRSRIKNGVEDITSIVKQLREIGGKEEMSEFVLMDVDMNWVVRDVCDVMEGAALSKDHTLEYIPKSRSAYVTADLPRLKRILFNLINNSIKYTRRGGTITLSVSASDREVSVSVADNGVGIPRDSFKDIFKPDKRLHRNGTEMENSSGLGLYICAHFAAQMNGRITLESELEQGSKFTLHLPLAAQTAIAF